MRMRRIGLAAAIVLVGTAAASAQVKSPLHITSEQEAKIYSTLSQGSLGSAPVGAELGVGAKVPAAVPLQTVPKAAPTPVRGYQYMVHSDRVYIVDPGSRKVVRVIPNR